MRLVLLLVFLATLQIILGRGVMVVLVSAFVCVGAGLAGLPLFCVGKCCPTLVDCPPGCTFAY